MSVRPVRKVIRISAETEQQSLDLSGLFTDLFGELSNCAERCIQRFRISSAWQAGELVNEAYLRLERGSRDTWDSRKHFVNYSSRLMRSLVVDDLRSTASEVDTEELDDSNLQEPMTLEEREDLDLEALDAAMQRLAIDHPLIAKAIEMRFSEGHEMRDIAKVLDMPIRTLERRWRVARRWLQTQLGTDDNAGQ